MTAKPDPRLRTSMGLVLLACVPGLLALFWLHGWSLLLNLLLCASAALLCEALLVTLRAQPLRTALNGDGSEIGALVSPSGKSVMFARALDPDVSGELMVARAAPEAWPPPCPPWRPGGCLWSQPVLPSASASRPLAGSGVTCSTRPWSATPSCC